MFSRIFHTKSDKKIIKQVIIKITLIELEHFKNYIENQIKTIFKELYNIMLHFWFQCLFCQQKLFNFQWLDDNMRMIDHWFLYLKNWMNGVQKSIHECTNNFNTVSLLLTHDFHTLVVVIFIVNTIVQSIGFQIGLRYEHFNTDGIRCKIVINLRDYDSLETIETYFKGKQMSTLTTLFGQRNNVLQFYHKIIYHFDEKVNLNQWK